MAYCDTVLCSGSAMADAIEMLHLALVETHMKALQGVSHAPPHNTVSLPRFLGRPSHPATRQSMSGCRRNSMCLCDSVVFLRGRERWC